tara:strand:- start:2595 stop:2789 length:195 start_codon:yes stop_codon:yes gene_type:complete
MEFLAKLLVKLNGAKTYVVGVAAMLTSLGAYLNGAITIKDLIEAWFAAITAMTIRHGITTTAGK